MMLGNEIKKMVYKNKTLEEILKAFPEEDEDYIKRLYQMYRARYRSDCAEALTHSIDMCQSEQTYLGSETNFFS